MRRQVEEPALLASKVCLFRFQTPKAAALCPASSAAMCLSSKTPDALLMESPFHAVAGLVCAMSFEYGHKVWGCAALLLEVRTGICGSSREATTERSAARSRARVDDGPQRCPGRFRPMGCYSVACGVPGVA